MENPIHIYVFMRIEVILVIFPKDTIYKKFSQ